MSLSVQVIYSACSLYKHFYLKSFKLCLVLLVILVIFRTFTTVKCLNVLPCWVYRNRLTLLSCWYEMMVISTRESGGAIGKWHSIVGACGCRAGNCIALNLLKKQLDHNLHFPSAQWSLTLQFVICFYAWPYLLPCISLLQSGLQLHPVVLFKIRWRLR